MVATIFCTGLTGYIGGDFLYKVSARYPEYNIRALIRRAEQGLLLSQQYSNFTAIYGDLDSDAVIEQEASTADVVLNFASCDHIESAVAIVKGMTRSTLLRSSYLIHTSGALVMATESLYNHAYGVELEQKYDDWDGVSQLVSLPDDAPHRNVDKIVLAAASERIKVAIVCPPTVYGKSRGFGNFRSMQINDIIRVFLQHGQAFQVGQGRNIWHQIHVQDLTDLYVLLTNAAVTEVTEATWNETGYYLAENGPFFWGDVCKAIARAAYDQGLLKSHDVISVSADTARTIWSRYNFFVGSTSRGQSIRGRRLLGWRPCRPPIFAELPAIVDQEARVLGLVRT